MTRTSRPRRNRRLVTTGLAAVWLFITIALTCLVTGEFVGAAIATAGAVLAWLIVPIRPTLPTGTTPAPDPADPQ